MAASEATDRMGYLITREEGNRKLPLSEHSRHAEARGRRTGLEGKGRELILD